MAGCGSNSTEETIDLVKHAEKSNADAILVTPYYNKPSDDGLYKHFKAISENVGVSNLSLRYTRWEICKKIITSITKKIVKNHEYCRC